MPRLKRVTNLAPPSRIVGPVLLALSMATPSAMALDSLQWNGFALLRPQTRNDGGALDSDRLSAQVQVGIDWRPSVAFGSHVHLLARNESDGAQRGRVGVVEAYLEQNVIRGSDRVHVMEGAFFLPTSRENVDSLWESPYTITPSALNSWFGEELRPVGVDVSWTHRARSIGAFTGGVTAFTGNDTFGAIIVDRGWALHDYWALLGEHAPVNSTLFTSVSAETDHRLGWSARGRWSNDHANLQITRIDNRSDALRHGDLSNWETPFNIAGGDYTWHDWTAVAETGWGTTAVVGSHGRRTFDIRSSYLLLSRRISSFRVSVRGDQYEEGTKHGHAVTAAVFWEPRGRWRSGIEGIRAGGQKRLALELRYNF
jgi:hypothetical protein